MGRKGGRTKRNNLVTVTLQEFLLPALCHLQQLEEFKSYVLLFLTFRKKKMLVYFLTIDFWQRCRDLCGPPGVLMSLFSSFRPNTRVYEVVGTDRFTRSCRRGETNQKGLCFQMFPGTLESSVDSKYSRTTTEIVHLIHFTTSEPTAS